VRRDHNWLPQPYRWPNCWLLAYVWYCDVQPPQFMFTGKPFCSNPPPKLPAIALTWLRISASLVSATGCHQRNFTRAAAGGMANVPVDIWGKYREPGPPGSGAPGWPALAGAAPSRGAASAGIAEAGAKPSAVVDSAAATTTVRASMCFQFAGIRGPAFQVRRSALEAKACAVRGQSFDFKWPISDRRVVHLRKT
jgi:hypothetical protein